MGVPVLPDLRADFDPTAVVLYGGGGHGKVLIELIQALGLYRLVGIVDDGLTAGEHVLGVPVLGGAEVLPQLYQQGVRLAVNGVGGIGHPEVRWRVFETLLSAGLTCPTLVHPAAYVERSARLEGGVQVLPQAYISSAVKIGFGTVINAGAVVSHDCVLGQCVNLSPGALLAGGVLVEDFVQIGMGATVNIGITVGRGARIGNGATVKADVPPGGVVRAGTIWPPPASTQGG
ncbi:MAG: acetyltransferase [Thermanaerothrix sp.]|uniref:Acetyltransferase n=2 Tax=Thermanaerothrix TaxID=1077886 RepID=A0ABU3NQ11_9CHLR|nr:acetyltransferase [Thermanaerothrix sp. 4228-RoL]MDT8898934.1 acetyltransferase [Thermanaerothrix sp. 4228-RoL]